MVIEELKQQEINSLEKMSHYCDKNRNGLFFLPDKLANLITEIAKLNSPKRLINLNSNFGEILNRCTNIEYSIGVDINSENVAISTYLNPHLSIINKNPIYYKDDKKFDSVICFPPLGQKIEVNNRKIRSEEVYVLKGLELLENNGSAIFLLPNNFLTAPVYADLRSNILKEFGIRKVISLPPGILGTSDIGLSIVEVCKYPISKTAFYKLADINVDILIIANPLLDFMVDKIDLSKRWDYSFHNPKNKIYEDHLRNFEIKKIEDLVEIAMGVPFKSEERLDKGTYQILTPRNIMTGKFKSSEDDRYLQKSELLEREKKAIIKEGDIVITRFMRENVGIYIHGNDHNTYIANQHLVILRGKNAAYVTTYLNTDDGIKSFNQQIKRLARGTLPTISIEDLKSMQIPILPIGNLEFASKAKLEELPYEELIEIRNKYINLKSQFAILKKEKSIAPHEELLNVLVPLINEVINSQKSMSTKLDKIQSSLDALTNDFETIKDLPRSLDEKISRLHYSLDHKLSGLLEDQKELDFYIQQIKKWFDYYDILEPKSQKYLPEAEYIFDQISKLKNLDYSPFILQYCRALENELLKKIFRAYVQSLIDRNIDLENEFSWDFSRKDSGKPNNNDTLNLGKHLKRCLAKDTDEWFFDLGSMEINLRNLTGRSVKKSPLLGDLRNFILNKFEQEILNIEYLDEIKTIIRDYRNQSAHPNLMNETNAVEFHKQIKRCLISLMENYKQ